jgi:hypothetical protein
VIKEASGPSRSLFEYCHHITSAATSLCFHRDTDTKHTIHTRETYYKPVQNPCKVPPHHHTTRLVRHQSQILYETKHSRWLHSPKEGYMYGHSSRCAGCCMH